jgi:hypothetical protein
MLCSIGTVVHNLMENTPFSFSNEQHEDIPFVCFVTELLSLLLSNKGDTSQDKESLIWVYFVLPVNRLERGTFPRGSETGMRYID